MKDGRKWLSEIVSMAVGLALTALLAAKGDYGWTLFVWVPFFVGFEAVCIYAWRKPRTLRASMWISLTPFAGICVGVLAWKIDGLICCLMAAPIVIPLGLLGGYLGWRLGPSRAVEALSAGLMLLVPAAVFVGGGGPHSRIFSVTTSIVVNAPPEIVWHWVTDFPAIEDQPVGLFRAGVAYPIRSDMARQGQGAGRQCILSTGTLAETVTGWDPARLLRFRVSSTPPAMRELSPWPDIDPPHLRGFYVSHQGEFRLSRLPGGETLVEGTSWYSHGLEPAQYWRLWSDFVVHGVHRRVLEHIKKLAETENQTLHLELAAGVDGRWPRGVRIEGLHGRQ